MNAFVCSNSRVTAAECRTQPTAPFGSLVDAAAALAAHARMPAGRVINNQNAAAEDAAARDEWLAERRRQHAEYRARVAARLKAIQAERAKMVAREADARRRARIKANQASHAEAVT